MGLLDNCPGFEPTTVYPEVVTTDADGNTITRASTAGVSASARWQIQDQSGTSSRRAEQQSEGFESEQVYTIRFPRGFQILGEQSKVRRDSTGEVFCIFGNPQRYSNSARTAHIVYTVRRS